ncbi:hypothetical protein TNIN_215431 [Trichonephila inaurata madagascariensis]|uniref:Uncharacterized protein n=1 Tax=Trichonephila inaurata madagascariensis TaxID=2747483 RepID=A0A8X6MAP7_9ARAC|nr:hypothetical protein TNIN_215431 [Trichonephila inaurata madagascariensis]
MEQNLKLGKQDRGSSLGVQHPVGHRNYKMNKHLMCKEAIELGIVTQSYNNSNTRQRYIPVIIEAFTLRRNAKKIGKCPRPNGTRQIEGSATEASANFAQ